MTPRASPGKPPGEIQEGKETGEEGSHLVEAGRGQGHQEDRKLGVWMRTQRSQGREQSPFLWSGEGRHPEGRSRPLWRPDDCLSSD